MKVLILTNAFPNSAEKTRGIFTYQIVQALREKCHVRVIAPLPWVPGALARFLGSNHPYSRVPFEEKIEGISVYHPRYLVIPKFFGFMHAFFMFFPLLRLINSLENQESIDIMNVHWLFPDGVSAAWIANKLHKPIILTGLGCDINLYPTMAFRRRQIISALEKADHITTVCNSLKDVVYSLGIKKEKVTVIPNGVDLFLFTIMDKLSIREKLRISPKRSIILTVGSLDEVKGTRFLIEAISLMKQSRRQPPLLVSIGDGPLKPSLFSLAKGLEVAEHVRFLGERPHKEIPLWMNAADVFCLPSIREGHPNVVIEALSCGTPVIAANVGAIPEIITNKNGHIWEHYNVNDLANYLKCALKQIWDREEIRRSVAGFSWDDCADKYHAIYSNLISRKKMNFSFSNPDQ
jgi:teichuronic acid biosynthesis glycosyltransferase TuaC